jgi:uncharacterized caspase-like protein
MSKLLSVIIAALCGCFLLTCSAVDAKAERRIALVVGNANYKNPSLVLSNPKNDAEDVASALRSLGFEVIQAVDTNKRDMDLSMAKFARLATDSDAVLFYYAGHALQYQGRNYLMPTDAEVEDEVSLRYQMMPIDDVRAALDRASGVKVMILDACRNNPVVESLRRRIGGESRALGGGVRGLARIDKTQGTVIAYSTAADEVAADGQGRNSPFTTALLTRLKEPGLEIEQLFRRVAADVNSATGGRQRPETYVSLLSDFYLNQTDRVAFDAIKDSANPVGLREFIARFPTSSYASDARYRIQRIELEAQEVQLQKARQQEAARLLGQPGSNGVAQDVPAASPAPRLDGSVKLAGAERKDLINQNSPPAGQTPRIAAEPPSPPAIASSSRSCDQDAARLSRLRGGGSLEEVVQFEAELACDKLRPQVARLRESLSGPATAAPVAQASKPAIAEQKTQTAALQSATMPAVSQTPTQPERPAIANPVDPSLDCKRDEARLARLRTSPSLTEIVAFERELGCEKLRAQIARIRESLNPADSSSPTAEDAAGIIRRRLLEAKRSVANVAPSSTTDTPDQAASPDQEPPAQQMAALPPQEAAPAKPEPTAAEITKSVKNELNRVGCFTGAINDEWNAASRRSLEAFNKRAGTKLDVKLASLDTLDVIRRQSTRVCPLVCENGYKRDGERCSKISCAEGSFLNEDNECEKRRAHTPTARRDREDSVPARPKAERPAPKAQASGQIVCDVQGCRPVARGCHLEFRVFGQGGPREGGGGNIQVCN